jgi:hypothetical protein
MPRWVYLPVIIPQKFRNNQQFFDEKQNFWEYGNKSIIPLPVKFEVKII